MSERYCPSCTRPLPHIWPERPFGSGIAKVPGEIMSPTCWQVPDNYGKGWVDWMPSCRMMAKVDEEDMPRERELNQKESRP